MSTLQLERYLACTPTASCVPTLSLRYHGEKSVGPSCRRGRALGTRSGRRVKRTTGGRRLRGIPAEEVDPFSGAPEAARKPVPYCAPQVAIGLKFGAGRADIRLR